MSYYCGQIAADGTVLDHGGPTGQDWSVEKPSTGKGDYFVNFITDVDPTKLDFNADIDPPTANWKTDKKLVPYGYEVKTLHNGAAADHQFTFTADFTP